MRITPLLLAAAIALASPTVHADTASLEAARSSLDAMVQQRAEFDSEAIDRAAEVFETAAKQEPRSGDWTLGLGIVEARRNEWKAARELFERAVEQSPDNPYVHLWYGDSLFQTIGEASIFAKGSMASKGRKAYERAVELDPSLDEARFGLAMFFMEAPGIAGGSEKKAREQAEALLESATGAYMGHSILSRMSAKDKDWASFERHFELGYEQAPDDETREQALRAAFSTMLQVKESPGEALTYATRLVELRGEDNGVAQFYMGWAKAELGDLDGAIVHYEKCVDALPQSSTPLLRLARALNDAGRQEEALERYRAYLERFPDREEAGEAKKEIRKLERTLR